MKDPVYIEKFKLEVLFQIFSALLLFVVIFLFYVNFDVEICFFQISPEEKTGRADIAAKCQTAKAAGGLA